MLIILNSKAGGGEAIKKWNKIRPLIDAKIQLNNCTIVTEYLTNYSLIHKAVKNGEKEFIAAGGDGTVNFLLNALMQYSERNMLNSMKLGAIGLGSSNDFHKPIINSEKNPIPIRVDFNSVQKRDVGYVKYCTNGKLMTKYFLINASIGLTAEGNNFFNHPDGILEKLKKSNTILAIYYAAVKTMFLYKNIKSEIKYDNENVINSLITNLGIVKSPHFSGNLTFNSEANYKDGLLKIHLSENLSFFNSILLLCRLTNSNQTNKFIKSRDSKNIYVKTEKNVNVEFDGETIIANSMNFGISPHKIQVCTL